MGQNAPDLVSYWQRLYILRHAIPQPRPLQDPANDVQLPVDRCVCDSLLCPRADVREDAFRRKLTQPDRTEKLLRCGGTLALGDDGLWGNAWFLLFEPSFNRLRERQA
ncbi:MAG TPA: hypothetical protein VHF01_02635 [Candidatus Acidoferrum sp.]|nr:hypothetical protein [Candidatus Acidoferrum sp.]